MSRGEVLKRWAGGAAAGPGDYHAVLAIKGEHLGGLGLTMDARAVDDLGHLLPVGVHHPEAHAGLLGVCMGDGHDHELAHGGRQTVVRRAEAQPAGNEVALVKLALGGQRDLARAVVEERDQARSFDESLRSVAARLTSGSVA